MSFRIITTISLVAGTTFFNVVRRTNYLKRSWKRYFINNFFWNVAEIPRALASTFELGRTGALSALMIVGIFVLVILTVLFIVFFERAMRKILINYPKDKLVTKCMEVSHHTFPLKINTAGVIPAIFASALLLLPITISNFGFAESDTFFKISSLFTQGQPLYMMLYASGIIFFSFFYTSIVFNPKRNSRKFKKVWWIYTRYKTR